MKSAVKRKPRRTGPERLSEAYEVRALRDEPETQATPEEQPSALADVTRPEAMDIVAAKDRLQGHGEQQEVPDDCQFGDNDLCNPEK